MGRGDTSDEATDRHVRFAAGVCAGAAGALAVFVLLTWLTGHWRLGTLGSDYVVMAPSTACLMILLSIAAFFRRVFRSGDKGRFLVRLAAAAIAATALLSWSRQLLVLRYPALEEWLDAAMVSMIGVSFAPLSPITVAVLLLTGVAFILDLGAPDAGRFGRRLGLLSALAGFITALAVILGYVLGAPASYGAQTTQIALPAALCLVLLNAAIMLDAPSGIWPLSVFRKVLAPRSPRMRRFTPALSVLFAFLVVSMGIVGGLYLRQQQAQMRHAAQSELEAVANAQVGLIVNWRAERMSDARFFADAPFVADEMREFLSSPDSGSARAAILRWLSVLEAGGRYRQIAVYDAGMNPRVGIPSDIPPPDAAHRELLSMALRENRVAISDFGDGGGGDAYVDIVAPLHAGGGATGGSLPGPEAVILLRAEARQLVSLLVRTWAGTSSGVETLLVRRNTGDMLLLGRGGGQNNTPPGTGIPVKPSDLAGTTAARGEVGFAEGPDYRGVPVVSAVRPIPGTPWSIVAKMDEAAIYAPSTRQMVQTASILLLLILAVGLGFGILWRQRNIAFYRESLDLEKSHGALAQRFEHLMRQANDIILMAGPDGTIREANDRAMAAYGYSLAALRGMSLSDLCTPQARAECERRTKELKEAGSVLFETVHQRADGAAFSVEVSGSTVDFDGESCLLGILRDISERERAAQALRAGEQNLRTLFDSIKDFLFVVDMGGNILRVNEVVVARLGYTMPELIGKSLLLLHPADRREEAAGVLEAMVSGKTELCSVPLLAKDGTVIPVETHVVNGRWSGQEVLFGVSRDISELRASEEKFVRLFQGNPALMAISTIEDGRYQEVNETFVQALGYSREEIVGATSLELNLFVEPDRRADMKKTLFETGALRNFEIAVRRKDGQIRNGLFSGDMIRMQDQQFLLTVMNDVTDLKRAEEALVRIGKAVDSASDAIGISDPNGVHIYQNQALTDLFGYTVEELGQLSGPMAVYRDSEKGREVFDSIMHGNSWAGELEMVAKDGRRFPVALRADSIKDEQGNVVGLIVVHTDITEQKRREEERQQLLEQTQRDARTKAELLAEVNHRVKNNLTAILGLLLGEKQHAPAECRENIVSVLDSLSQRIRGLLQCHQLLSDAHWAPIRLHDLAVRVIRAALIAVPRGREISVTVRPSSAQISPRQAGSMALALNELAVNTAKHAFKDREQVSITLGVREEDGIIRLEYRDDGPGYPAAVLEEDGGGVGMHLLQQLVTGNLRGMLSLYNEDGAVAVLCIKTEDTRQT